MLGTLYEDLSIIYILNNDMTIQCYSLLFPWHLYQCCVIFVTCVYLKDIKATEYLFSMAKMPMRMGRTLCYPYMVYIISMVRQHSCSSFVSDLQVWAKVLQCGNHVYTIVVYWYVQPFGTRIKCPEFIWRNL